MYLLAEVIPAIKKLLIRFSRDQAIMFLTALMLVLVGVDIYFAHDLDAVIKPNEWIPIIFSPVAGLVLFFAGWISLKHRQAANLLAAWPTQGPPELQGALNCQGSLEQVQQWFTRAGVTPTEWRPFLGNADGSRASTPSGSPNIRPT